jgi:YVTN family beta-propeller protein
MEVRILGPLEVWAGGRQLDLGGGRQRALLAILALNRNRVVSSDRLIEELWGERAPPTAAKGLQNLVAQLRHALAPAGAEAIVTTTPGYVLRLGDAELDADRFESLTQAGRQLLETDPAQAAERIREALALWRGEALADFAYEGFAQREIARLDELRLTAIENRIDADLALGRVAELIPELKTMAASHPGRERLCEQLMLALYRSGRQAEALEAYRQVRATLQHDRGLEPNAALKQLEHAILTQDPSLDAHPRVTAPARRGRPRRLALAGTALVLVTGGLAGGAVLRGGDAASVDPVPHSLLKLDARTNRLTRVHPVGHDPGQVEVVGEYVFVAGQADGTLSRVHRRSGEVTTSARYDATGSIAGSGDNSLWVASVSRDQVSWVQADSLDPFERVSLSHDGNLIQSSVEVGGGSLWVSEWSPPAVARWHLRTLGLARRYQLTAPEYPLEIAFGHGSAWVALWTSNQLLRIRAADGRTSHVRVGNGPRDPAAGFGSIWSAMGQDDTVWRIDARTAKVQAIIRVGNMPWGVAVGRDSVWVTNHCDGTVSRIDPESDEVVATVATGFHPQWLAAADGDVWVGLAERPGAQGLNFEGCSG